jgi:hypothetical protein
MLWAPGVLEGGSQLPLSHLQESVTWDGSLDFGEQLGASYMAASEAVEREPDLLGSGELGGGGGGDAAAALGSRVAGLPGLPLGRRVSLLAGWVMLLGSVYALATELGPGWEGHAHGDAEENRPNGLREVCSRSSAFSCTKEPAGLSCAGCRRSACERWRISRGCPTGTGCPMLRLAGASCWPACFHELGPLSCVCARRWVQCPMLDTGRWTAGCCHECSSTQHNTTAEQGFVHAFAATAAGRQTVGRAPRLPAQLTTTHRHQMGGPSCSSCVPCGCRRPGADKELLNTAAAVAREASD